MTLAYRLVGLAAALTLGGCGASSGADGGGSGGGTIAGGVGGSGAGGGGTGGGAPPDAGPNHPPVVDADITLPATAFSGQYLTASIGALDEDGDPLTYAWTQTAPANVGTFLRPSFAITGWYSPEVTTPITYGFRVSVTDGRSAPVVRTADLSVSAARFTDVYTTLLGTMTCTQCHGGGAPSQGMSFAISRASAYAQLVNVDHQQHPLGNPTACTAQGIVKRVVPFDPQRSLLSLKVSWTQPQPACGATMPQMALTPLPVYRATMIRSWISAGALDD